MRLHRPLIEHPNRGRALDQQHECRARCTPAPLRVLCLLRLSTNPLGSCPCCAHLVPLSALASVLSSMHQVCRLGSCLWNCLPCCMGSASPGAELKLLKWNGHLLNEVYTAYGWCPLAGLVWPLCLPTAAWFATIALHLSPWQPLWLWKPPHGL